MKSIQILETSEDELIRALNLTIGVQFSELEKKLTSKNANEELLTRKETCSFLQIDQSTLWHWTKKGKVKAYGIANRRYYKRSELMESLKLVKG